MKTRKSLITTFSLLLTCSLLTSCVSTEVANTRNEIRNELIARNASRVRARGAIQSHTGLKPTDDLPRLVGPLSLKDAITLAMANNRTLRTAYLTRSESEGLVTQSIAEALPNITADASASVREPAENQSDFYSLGVEVMQPLWRSGSVAAGLRYAKLYAASNDFAIREQVQITVFDVVSQYTDILLKQHLLDVYEEASAVAERLLATTRSRRKQGTVSDYEVLRAEVEVARTNAERINGRNARQSAIVALFQSLGVSQDSDVTFSGHLAYTAEAFDLTAASAIAAVERPDIARAHAALKMAEEQIKIVQADYGPKADAFASGDYSNVKNDSWNDEWILGARVKLIIFDGFERRGRMTSTKSRRDQAEEKLRDTEERAHVQLVDALLRLRYADELYHSQEKNIELATEALRIIEVGSNRGRNTQVEVLDARAALTEAMGTYYKAIHAQGLARLSIRRVMGTLSPNDPMDSIVTPPPTHVSPTQRGE